MNIVCLYITVFVIFWSLLQTVIFDRDLIEDGFESQKKKIIQRFFSIKIDVR